MPLTKTDFLQFLSCPKSLWLLKHDPGNYPHGEFSAFHQKLAREGQEVERYARLYLQASGERDIKFQREIESADGLFARIDAVERTPDGEHVLYEVKSSTSVKTDAAHNHIKDACFQKICAERSGLTISKVFLVHLDNTYLRAGAVDPVALLTFANETDRVVSVEAETKDEIDSALAFLNQPEIERPGCSCLTKSRSNHCDTFAMLNPGMPTPSIYSLPRLKAAHRKRLVGEGLFDPCLSG